MDAHKQFTTVHIKESGVKNSESAAQQRLDKIQMRVVGNYQGIDQTRGAPTRQV